jgi:hypothetical protein
MPGRHQGNRTLMANAGRIVGQRVQAWGGRENACDQQRKRANKRKQFPGAVGVRCAPVHSLMELSQSAQN